MGRPGTGAWFRDIEKVAMALAKLKPHFEKENPVTQLMTDPATGSKERDSKRESAVGHHRDKDETSKRFLNFSRPWRRSRKKIDTVISVGVASRCLSDGSIPHEEWVRKAGYRLSANGKTNIGLGRPLFRED